MALVLAASAAAAEQPPTYSQVHTILAKHCLACHDSQERKGRLVLENHELLLKGGRAGPAVQAGDPDASELYLRIITDDPDELMPPPDKGEKLAAHEVAVIRDWIKAGAPGLAPGEELPARPVVLPAIAPKVNPRRPVHALAYAPAQKLLAVARHGEVELVSAENRAVVRTLAGHKGNVNDVVFGPKGGVLFAAAGDIGAAGEVRLWNTADGKLLRTIEGHGDAIYCLAVSPDGKILATGSYDQKIILWNTTTGEKIRALEGHNGCVYGLAFRPDGKVLASASADWTLKLWEVATGRRLETFSEPLKDLHAVAFSPDGQRVAGGGVDNRIRVWQISPTAMEGTNSLLYAQFAHEGTILRLAYSADGKSIVSTADDRTVKVWDAGEVTARFALEAQNDWPTAVTWAMDDKLIVVGRLDGTLGYYSATDGKVVPPPAPALTGVEPRGIQRGQMAKVKLTGSNLIELTQAHTNNAKLTAALAPDPNDRPDTAWLNVTAAEDLPPGVYHLNVSNAGGAAPAPMVIHVDTVPQVAEDEPNDAPAQATAASLPISFWGMLDKTGDADHYTFDAKAGQVIVLDLAGQRLGSKADAVLTLTDATGRLLASNNRFDGQADPLIAYTIPSDGHYTVRVSEHQLASSKDHFYRLSIGEFPFVTGFHPLGVAAHSETVVELAGYNLPAGASVTVKAGAGGEVALPLDGGIYRSRTDFKVFVNAASPETLEAEPNDMPGQATTIPAPGVVNGRIWATRDEQGGQDADLFRFEAKAGQPWAIETMAQRHGSPADTKIEILHEDGRPVQRLLLRAVRDSYLTFRPIDANAPGGRYPNWEEMKLNDYLYMNGEVVKLFLAPRGPDSQWDFYSVGGRRKCFFDTSATAHPLDEPAYIVEPLEPGTATPDNGLPNFPLYYANDDDAERKLGTDSKLIFTAPADGTYLVRVTDARGFSGDRYAYRLILRPAMPDFTVSVSLSNMAIPAGAGREVNIGLNRIDGFEGPVRIDITGLPPGFSASSPLYVEEHQDNAKAIIYAAPDASQAEGKAWSQVKVTAVATINGKEVSKPLGHNFAKATLGPKPQIVTRLLNESDGSPLSELTIAPGQMVSALLRIERNGFDGVVTYGVLGLLNVPHGVITADLGLNGLTLLEGQTERRIFFHCADNTAEKSQTGFAVTDQAGRPTSAPLTIHVRRLAQQARVP